MSGEVDGVLAELGDAARRKWDRLGPSERCEWLVSQRLRATLASAAERAHWDGDADAAAARTQARPSLRDTTQPHRSLWGHYH